MTLFQWLAVPFAMTHHAVGSLTETAFGNKNDTWLGEIEPHATGLWIDNFLLMWMGGMPWQVAPRNKQQVQTTVTAYSKSKQFQLFSRQKFEKTYKSTFLYLIIQI